jgi:hypothetical protein
MSTVSKISDWVRQLFPSLFNTVSSAAIMNVNVQETYKIKVHVHDILSCISIDGL